jgi:hypothetical protein
MAKAQSLDPLVIGDLMSRDEPKIAAALERAEALGWDLSQTRKALADLLDPVLDAGYLEEWLDRDAPSVPGPRLECGAGPVPLVSALERLPGAVPYLPWRPGRRVQFSLYHYTEPFHNIPFEQLEQVQQQQAWTLALRTRDWADASTALVEAGGCIDEQRDLRFDDYFAVYPHIGEKLRAQAAGAGDFLLGIQVEFEGHHNDAGFSVLLVRPAVTFSAGWRSDTVLALARQMDDSRDFSALPILADALQDAGCGSGEILDYCRGAGPHVRVCWVVDMVLDKE